MQQDTDEGKIMIHKPKNKKRNGLMSRKVLPYRPRKIFQSLSEMALKFSSLCVTAVKKSYEDYKSRKKK